MRAPGEHRSRGFTLLEILVALAVLAIALTAAIRAVGQSIDTAAALGEMGGTTWRWTEQVSATPVPKLRRIDVRVSPPDKPDTIVVLTGFVRWLQ